MQILLEHQRYLTDEEKSFRRSIEKSIEMLHQLNEEFQQFKAKLELTCHEHFNEIRRQIDLHCEQLKEKIDNIREEMIAKTKAFEATCVKQLTNKTETIQVRPCEKKSLDKE